MEKKLLFFCPILILLINSLHTVKILFCFWYSIGFDRSLQDQRENSSTLLFHSWKSAAWFNILALYTATDFGLVSKPNRCPRSLRVSVWDWKYSWLQNAWPLLPTTSAPGVVAALEMGAWSYQGKLQTMPSSVPPKINSTDRDSPLLFRKSCSELYRCCQRVCLAASHVPDSGICDC